MQLDVSSFPVSDITFGHKTEFKDSLLTVNRQELLQMILADPRVIAADIEIAKPGERVRVIHVCDAIEPRIKALGAGGCYPGVLGPVETVGRGVTHCLSGMAVILSAEYPRLIESGTGAAYEAILDMSGPGALSPLSQTLNLVLVLRLNEGHAAADYHQAVRMAGFKVSEALAETLRGMKPPHLRRYELGPVDSGLPRVVYVHQTLTQLNLPAPYITWYGSYMTDWMPFWAHPNEILDGALLPGAFGGFAVKPTSWEHVNNPLIARLYDLHGEELEFAGVIIQRTRFETFEEKQLSANQAAKLARLMKADGALITWIAAGNAFMEGMLTVKALEQEGIKTVFMTYEHGGKQGVEAPLMYTVPEADAIISVGSLDRPISLPPVERVIGGADLSVNPEASYERIPAAGEINLDWYLPVVSAVDHWGFGRQTCVEY